MPRARRRNRPAVIGILAFFVAMTTVWAIATPLGGYPDDIDHYLRATGASHGQFLGEPNPYLDKITPPAEKSCCDAANPAAAYWVQAGLRTVTVPADIQPEHVNCDAAVANPRFVCNGPPPRPDDRYDTLMGTIEPVAYVVPGIALAIFGGSSNAFRFGRITLALVGILAIGLVLAGCAGRPSFSRRVVGLCLATTPMVLFVLSSGSPNAAEIAGAIGLWLAVLELTAEPVDRAPRALWAGLALSGVLLATARSLGPVFVLVVFVVVAVARGAPPLRQRVKVDRTPVLLTLVAVALAALSTVLWEAWVQPHVAVDRQFAVSQIDAAWADIPRVLHEVVGDFGSLEVPLPDPVVYLWWTLGLMTVAVALLTGRWRGRAALVLLLSGAMAAVLVIDTMVMRQNGFAVQGRHVLAVFVGIPLLATDVVRSPPWLVRLVPTGVTRRLGSATLVMPALVGGLCAVLQFYAWVYAASAYTPTPTGRLLTVPLEGNWSIEHPKPLVALALAAAVALTASVTWSLLRSSAAATSSIVGPKAVRALPTGCSHPG